METDNPIFSCGRRIYVGNQDFAALPNQYTEYLDFFTTDSIPLGGITEKAGRIFVRISADNEYLLWLNGVPVSFGQHDSYPDAPCFDEVDVTDYAFWDGPNKLAVLVYHLGRSNSTCLAGNPGVIFEVLHRPDEADARPAETVLLASSEKTLSRIAPEYSSGEIPSVSPQLGFTFEYDALCYDGWEKTQYELPRENKSVHCWLPASVRESDEALRYRPRPIRKLQITEPAETRIVAQGLFDYGNEYRTARQHSPAYYMQHAAMKALRFGELETRPDHPLRTLAPCTHPFLPSYAAQQAGAGEERDILFSSSFGEPGAEPGKAEPSVLCGKGIYAVIDLGKEECGYLSFDLEAPEGTLIAIGYGDHLDDLRVRSYIGGRNYSCSYICGGGRSVFSHFIQRIAGRYLQIFAETDTLKIRSLGLLPVRYPLCEETRGEFHYSDALHTKIYETALHTLRLCMHEHYEDCPHREQALYAMDSRNQMLCGYYAFGEYAFARESLRLLAGGLRSDGLLELCAPASVSVTIPSFSLYWIQGLTEYVLYSGDLAFAEEMLPTAEKILKHFSLRAMPGKAMMTWRGRQYWNFHEWSEGLDGSFADKITEEANGNCYDANLTSLFIVALERIAQTCAFIAMNDAFSGGQRDDFMKKANGYLDLCENMKKQFTELFFDETTGLYASYLIGGKLCGCSELTNALAIYAGACSPQHLPAVTEALKGGGSGTASNMKAVTLSHTIYKYEALLLADSRHIDYVMQDIERQWGGMLFAGATSFWETARGGDDFGDAGSLCHGWSAIPIIVYYKYILGLRPTRPGFAEYVCNPRPYKGHQAAGSVVAPSGRFELTVSEGNYSCKKKNKNP